MKVIQVILELFKFFFIQYLGSASELSIKPKNCFWQKTETLRLGFSLVTAGRPVTHSFPAQSSVFNSDTLIWFTHRPFPKVPFAHHPISSLITLIMGLRGKNSKNNVPEDVSKGDHRPSEVSPMATYNNILDEMKKQSDEWRKAFLNKTNTLKA